MQCPKCHAAMHTYNRNGVQIEQCSGCRGIFLDYGELEALTRLESQYTTQQYGQVPPPAAPPAPYPAPHVAPAPAWGAPHHGGHGHHGRHKGGFGRMLFSS
ncbi:zf-TFIIB domain-containing protein [Streptomyces sp. ISL-44]|uniref:TFIIB-type zinc ribbon-containing protein n=1 Tax=unclassified Streptomyces TaxID=2593676 RepID=UPI001BEA9313|nr:MULTISPECIES: zf-TFIIB domain-containing protein [unclassified Streptomyces]MBT2545949.1 zf-TFIIB domain-containing protein [Streptomyces sp. ISL-44]MCX5016425.1 zf-TFIIB domain-containing protein [Streptomyces sp. NBC_00555]MCX5608950.1 zf-TFIIB domain-containing protein [Streptomyces sp. NBC_00047]UUU42899.1 zf-TFIIB domain-containing protein [Streptomyces sp. NBC_00162]